MASSNLEWDREIIEASGFTDPPNVASVDGERATGGTVGSVIIIGLQQPPTDYHEESSGNSVSLTVRARVSRTGTQLKRLRLTLQDPSGDAIRDVNDAEINFTTPPLTVADTSYTSPSFTLADNYGRSDVSGWLLRLEVVAPTGSVDEETVEVDYLAVAELQYQGVVKFDHLALSLSGGGSRANGYHLGVLWTLNQLKTGASVGDPSLLDNVDIISSASGGSLICTTWALAVESKTAFPTYFSNTIQAFHNSDLVQDTLKRLRDPDIPTPFTRPSNRYDLVTAIADAFDDNFYMGAKMGDLPASDALQVIVNAADFKYSVGFRFQNFAPIGSDLAIVDPADAKEIRVADVMASSCALPLAFEPIMFPNDFYWVGGSLSSEYNSIRNDFLGLAVGAEAIPLMDGGMYDDQGIDAVLRAVATPAGQPPQVDQRYMPEALAAWLQQALDVNQYKIDAYVVSDVTPVKDPVYRSGYAPPPPPPPPYMVPPQPALGWFSIRGVFWTWILLVVLGLVTLFAVLYLWLTSGFGTGWRLFIEIVALAGSVLGLLGLGYLGKLGIRTKDSIQKVLETEGVGTAAASSDAWGIIRRLKVRLITWMAELRLGSTPVAPNVLISRARQLGYQLLYGSKAFRGRVLANPIYQLLETNNVLIVPQPTQLMKDIAAEAAKQPVSFWYDVTKEPFPNQGELATLVACGQMTTCWNVLRYIEKKLGDGYLLSAEAMQVLTDATVLWTQFRNDPWVHTPNLAIGQAPSPGIPTWLIVLIIVVVIVILLIILL